MKILFLLTLYLSSFYIFSQAPEIQWQNAIGGNSTDDDVIVHQTPDGGYIVAGDSHSGITGEKTVPHLGDSENSDIWILKLTEDGIIEWQKNIGGDAWDYMGNMVVTFDGGCILAVGSESDASIYKSENNLGFYPTDDIWIVKLDPLGDIEWENTIGGDESEFPEDIFQTSDGGYIVAAVTKSGISDDKTETNIGGYDYWIIKLNNLGIIEWQNTIGGTSEDYIKQIRQTSDGGYIVGGSSISGVSGDKTEPVVTTGIGLPQQDMWILKLNSSGAIEWQNTIGGESTDYTKAIEQTDDNGYIIAGYSLSGIFGDKTEPSWGSFDFWVLKLDEFGNILWQNSIGGSALDALRDLDITTDGGYIIAGYSSSGISGDKTEPFYDGAYSDADYWILKLNPLGNIEWQNTIGGFSGDVGSSIEQTADFGYIIGGHSNSYLSADKTDAGNGAYDYWIIKLEPDCSLIPEICNTLDDNCNGLIDDDINYEINISAAGPTTFCQGNSVILNATTSGPNYQWKKNGVNIPGAIFSSYTVSTKGTYTCETSSACDTELSTGIFVNVQKNPPASITAGGATTFCAGGSVVLTANAGGGLSYKWYKDAVLIPGATSINYTATTAGFYKCNVTKTSTGCNKNSNGIMVTVPCKEGEELLSNSNFTIFPNPNNGTFNLIYNSPTGAISPLEGGPRGVMTIIQIFNSLGQQIHSQQINSHDGIINETINIENISSGIYIVQLKCENIFYNQKLIVE